MSIAPGQHTLADGRTARVIEIAGGGLLARVASLGATLLSLSAPDAEGHCSDVVLGHARLDGYIADPAYLGVAVGRTAGRIRDAQIVVDGRTVPLDANDGPNTLHGGPEGLHTHVWDVAETAPHRVVFETTSPDGQGGYPGTLQVRLSLSLVEAPDGATGGALRLDWRAAATAPTPVALTYHPYLNLDGHDAGTVRDHVVTVPASGVVEIGEDLAPTGRLVPVAGTPFDLRQPTRLGGVLASDDPALAGGLDHDWLIAPLGIREAPLRHVLTVTGASRRLDAWTTEPSVHLYDGAFLDVADGKGGAHYRANAGLAVETQPPPDARRLAATRLAATRLAVPWAPDVVLRPGETLRSRTEYRFSPLYR